MVNKMEFEDIYEIFYRIENARYLIRKDPEQAEQVLKILENDLKGLIYTNDPFEIIDSLRESDRNER